MYKKAADEEMKSRKLGGSKTQKVFMAWFLMCCMFIISATAVSAVSDSVIPDTGQTLCYDGSGVEITCPAAGQPLAQDGSYSNNPPDYTDNLDGTVLDGVTGLQWLAPWAGTTVEINATTNNITVSDTLNTFTRASGSWIADGFVVGSIFVTRGFAAEGNNGIFAITDVTDTVVTVVTFGGGDPSLIDVVDAGTTDLSFSNEKMTWAEAGSFCSVAIPGYRLPTIKELNQIADYGTSDPAINAVFVNTNSASGSGYWSATESAEVLSSALNIHFDTASNRIDGRNKDEANYVMCVSGTELTSDFVDNGTTISDNNTGLMWQQSDDNTARIWEAAITYCEGLTLQGYTDWRLPNIKEIQTIVDYSTYNPAVNTAYFPGTSGVYWSSTTDDAFNTSTWALDSSDGSVLSNGKTPDTLYTRCVRENQVDTTPPVTTIDSGPTQPTSASTSATFTFHANETGSTFQCKLDDTGPYSTYASCTSSKTYTGLATGLHTFYVYATDQAGNDDPLSPTTYAWTIDTTAPDLSITVLTAPATAGQGDTINVTDTQTNTGTADAGASTTRFYLSVDSVLSPATDTLLGTRAVPAIAMGLTSNATTALDIPVGTAAGTYYIIAKADFPNVIVETNETNNTKASAAIKIGPDLTVTVLTVPAIGGAGASINVTDTTKNSGGGDASASITGFYLSVDSVLSPATDTLLGTRAVGALASGLTSNATTALDIPVGTAAGTYYIIAKADGPNAIAETNEGNNAKSSTTIKIGPDLTITVLTVPAIGGAGASINVTDTTKNSGGGDASASITRFYLSVDSALSPATDTWLGTRAVGALASGLTSNATTALDIPVGTATGTYYIIAKADFPNVIVETNETNNTKASAAIKIGPDLTVTVLTVPAIGGAGASINVTDTTKNSGGGDASASITRFYLSADTVLNTGGATPDVLLSASKAVPGLAAGASSSTTTSVTIPGGTTAGTYYVIAKADADAAVAETNETNNTKASAAIKIGGDLTVTVLTVPATAAAGASINVTDTTKNSGGDAAASTTRFYLSDNTAWDAGDTELGSGRAVGALPAGVVSSGTTSVTIPVGTTAGTYYVIAKADADAAVAETNETNNTKASAAIKIGGDFTVTVLTVPATSAGGASINVTDTTKNSGAGAVAASRTRFYLSANSALDGGDTELGTGRAVGALAAGVVSSGTTSVTIPAGTATGSYYIIAKADGNNAIPETSETNNTKYVAITIGPDLTVSLFSGVPATSGAGATFNVSNTILNSGGASAAASTVRFHLSTDTVVGAGDISLGTRAIGALATGGSSNASTSLTIPVGQTAGSYYIIAKADDGGVITESSETNNTKYAAIKIGPDLSITVFTVPTTGTAGVAFNVSDTTKNSGGGDAVASTTKFYQSANSVLDAGDTLLGSRAVGALAAGVSSASTAPGTSLTISAAGTYYIIAKTDAGGTPTTGGPVAETSEVNNTMVKMITVH